MNWSLTLGGVVTFNIHFYCSFTICGFIPTTTVSYLVSIFSLNYWLFDKISIENVWTTWKLWNTKPWEQSGVEWVQVEVQVEVPIGIAWGPQLCTVPSRFLYFPHQTYFIVWYHSVPDNTGFHTNPFLQNSKLKIVHFGHEIVKNSYFNNQQ